MAITYKKIASVTVGAAGAANIEFTSIPGTYTDLLLRVSARSNRAIAIGDEMYIYFNGSNTSVSSRILYGTGTAPASYSSATNIINLGVASTAATTTSIFGSADFYIPNYAGSTNKSVSMDGVSENNGTDAYQSLSAGLWSNTAAITSITLDVINGTDFLQYSSATLYGILKA